MLHDWYQRYGIMTHQDLLYRMHQTRFSEHFYHSRITYKVPTTIGTHLKYVNRNCLKRYLYYTYIVHTGYDGNVLLSTKTAIFVENGKSI